MPDTHIVPVDRFDVGFAPFRWRFAQTRRDDIAADFLAWRDWDFPDPAVVNCFAMGALRASDGAYLMGVMSDRTANPGRIYFPAGTPDPNDVRGETVDLLGNVMRELAEETGLTAADVAVAPGWHAVVDAARVAVMKPIDVPYPAAEVRTRMLRYLASETQPELSDVRIVRSAADLDCEMPRFVTAYLAHMWSGADWKPTSG